MFLRSAYKTSLPFWNVKNPIVIPNVVRTKETESFGEAFRETDLLVFFKATHTPLRRHAVLLTRRMALIAI